VLYVSGEESPSQIALRIKRILQVTESEKNNPVTTPWAERLRFVTSTDVDVVTAAIRQYLPCLVIVDSIQTITTEDLSGAAGSVGQIRETAERLTRVIKELHIPTFLVGHVTKEGELAGPKVLEHIVDSVLELSGERRGDFRLLRAVKNRFGATDEVGVFKVTERGYDGVTNPSELFIEHAEEQVPGSATICVMEGTRPLLIEVQALVVQSQLAMPRRVGRGVELSRLQMLAAVLQKHCRLNLGSTDIFASVAGGFVVREPVVDLGLAVAIASSLKNKPMPKKTVFIGEVGLLGEIRNVSYLERRVKEAQRLGFEHIITREKFSSVREVLKKFNLIT
jgi:DNA repair protein RadA/Sms